MTERKKSSMTENKSLKVRYKLIEHERVEDAPFVGALISAIGCSINCPNCFNQHLKKYPTREASIQEIIKEVKGNFFNQGIILAGLEWTEQPEEMKGLIEEALRNNMEVMIYSGLSEDNFIEKFPGIWNNQQIYIKTGGFKKEDSNEHYYSEGVKLASSNQRVRARKQN